MELALSLGDTPKPFTFLDKNPKIMSNKDIGFCMALGSAFSGRSDEKREIREGDDRREVIRDGRDSSDPPVQLDLLPFSPVPRNQPPAQLRFPWLADNCNVQFLLSAAYFANLSLCLFAKKPAERTDEKGKITPIPAFSANRSSDLVNIFSITVF